MRSKCGSSLNVTKDSHRREIAIATLHSSIWRSLGVRDALSCGIIGMQEGVFPLISCNPSSVMHSKVTKCFTISPIHSVVWKNAISLHSSSSEQFYAIGLIILISISLCRAFHEGFPVVVFTHTPPGIWPQCRCCALARISTDLAGWLVFCHYSKTAACWSWKVLSFKSMTKLCFVFNLSLGFMLGKWKANRLNAGNGVNKTISLRAPSQPCIFNAVNFSWVEMLSENSINSSFILPGHSMGFLIWPQLAIWTRA